MQPQMGVIKATLIPANIITGDTSGALSSEWQAWRIPIITETNPNVSAIEPNSFTKDGCFQAASKMPTKQSVMSDI